MREPPRELVELVPGVSARFDVIDMTSYIVSVVPSTVWLRLAQTQCCRDAAVLESLPIADAFGPARTLNFRVREASAPEAALSAQFLCLGRSASHSIFCGGTHLTYAHFFGSRHRIARAVRVVNHWRYGGFCGLTFSVHDSMRRRLIGPARFLFFPCADAAIVLTRIRLWYAAAALRPCI